jgi:hypothetical protein
MSRYYAVRITDPKTNEILVPNYNGKPGFTRVAFNPQIWTYSSLYQGGDPSKLASNNANALGVSFDIPVGFLHAPLVNACFKIYGVSVQEVSQGSNLNGMNIAIYGGMAKGLPLANPVQIGPLCRGQIQQAFGNWIDTLQYLEIYIQAGGSSSTADQVTGSVVSASTLPVPTTNDQPANIVFQWKPGQHLTDAVLAALQPAYPQYTIAGTVNENLVWTGTAATAFFSKLSQFADYIRKATLNLLGGYAPDRTQYMGVVMTLQNNVVTLFDGTAQTKPRPLYVADLVGQPGYSQPLQIQVTCVLRGDIKVGDYVTLPLGQLNIQAGAQVGYVPPPPLASVNSANAIAFQGSYLVTTVRHVGDSRDGAGTSWVTTLDVLQTQPYNASAAVATQQVLAKPSAFNFYLPT